MEIIPTQNFQPDIQIGGLRIGEPVIVLTGLLLSGFCFYAWGQLRKKQAGDEARTFARLFFLLMGVSTVVGAFVGHFFLYCLPFEAKLPGWILSMVAVSALEQFSLLRARFVIGEFWYKNLTRLNVLEFALAICFVVMTLWFPAVEIHSAFGLLLIVAPLEALLYIKHGNTGSRRILIGIGWLVVAVLVHILKISLNAWFCYFDIAHILMCIAIWQMMRGALFDPPTSAVV
ncbi:MAG: hypothetical protein SFV22_10875 [Saprospiraceae bacterium]|nr:hypothetical protein [Saprospiraceae bacterium]